MRLAVVGSQVLIWRTLQKGAGVLLALAVMQGLGPEGNGRYSLSISAIMVLAALLSGGVGLASVPRLHGEHDPPRRIVRAQAAWFAVVALILLVLGLAVRFGPGWAWCVDSLGWSDGLLMAVALAVLGIVAYETANYDLLATGRVVIGSLTAGLRALVLATATALLVLVAGAGVDAALLAFAAVHLAAAATLLPRAWRALSRLPDAGRHHRSLPSLVAHLVRQGWLGQLSALIYLLLLRLDQFLIEGYLDVTAVGLYAAAAWITELLWLVPEALNPLLVHTSSSRRDDDRDQTAARAVRLGLGVTAVAALPLALVAEPLLGLLRDGAFLPAATPLLILLPGAVAFAPGVILAGDFIGRGHPQWNTQASAITVVVNVALCLLWLPRFGIAGAAWASTVAYAVGSAVMVWRFRRLTGLPWGSILVPRLSDLRR
jgi:O-antigen/teichoic acid export membrane protein